VARNPLKDIADTMPHVIAGRMDPNDFEALADLPDGVLTVDLLTAEARHSSGSTPKLHVVTDLVAWLDDRLAAARFARSSLTQVELAIAISTKRVVTDRARIIPFDLVCTATFATEERTFTSKPATSLRWYKRIEGVLSD
jgi:hypothetical protein